MFDDNDRPGIDSAALPAPGWGARIRFFVRRHPVAITILVGLLAGGGAALLVASETGLWADGNAPIFMALATPGFACFVIALGPVVMARKRTANGEDFAAALAAASVHERPHLLATIENRLSSRLWSAPMTTFELVLAFEEVREQHGDRARCKRLVDQRGRIEQKRFIGQLADSANDTEWAGQGAL